MMLQVENLSVSFNGGGRGKRNITRAVRDVSFEVRQGETLGLVGESGCGKSSLARTLMLLNKPSAGRVLIDGEDIHKAARAERKDLRRNIQMVFQDPAGSMNPRMTIGSLITEPLIVHGFPRTARQGRLHGLLDDVGLPRSVEGRFPHELSGGQLQRASIARALAVEPKILVADEPVSALDVSVQVQIINLLMDLQAERNLTYVFISHDLAVVSQVSDRVAVMYLGEIVEIATTDDIFDGSKHPYTRSLLSAVAVPDPGEERIRERIVLTGDIQSAASSPGGCQFHTRCWLRQQLDNPERCITDSPKLQADGEEHRVACHFSDVFSDQALRARLISQASRQPVVG
jgi:oligopeptide/dipeptide ABC transporter ATP-binding protein